jgi:hypothetical protein
MASVLLQLLLLLLLQPASRTCLGCSSSANFTINTRPLAASQGLPDSACAAAAASAAVLKDTYTWDDSCPCGTCTTSSPSLLTNELKIGLISESLKPSFGPQLPTNK